MSTSLENQGIILHKFLMNLFVLDMFRTNLTDNVKKRLQRNNSISALIPGGLTYVLQPFDVSQNKSLKKIFVWHRIDGWWREKRCSWWLVYMCSTIGCFVPFCCKVLEGVHVEIVKKSVKKKRHFEYYRWRRGFILMRKWRDQGSKDSKKEMGVSNDSGPYAEL